MISSNVRPRQPVREVWTRERLVRERAIALGQAIDNSTWKNYGSALNSYLNFIKMHDWKSIPYEGIDHTTHREGQQKLTAYMILDIREVE